jgi:hypothetical protein
LSSSESKNMKKSGHKGGGGGGGGGGLNRNGRSKGSSSAAVGASAGEASTAPLSLEPSIRAAVVALRPALVLALLDAGDAAEARIALDLWMPAEPLAGTTPQSMPASSSSPSSSMTASSPSSSDASAPSTEPVGGGFEAPGVTGRAVTPLMYSRALVEFIAWRSSLFLTRRG